VILTQVVEGDATSGKKTVFLSHLYIEMLCLPRQARDKHRENSKQTVFLQQSTVLCCRMMTCWARMRMMMVAEQ
jgi:hypothetical protein